ncbi:MULTISPECIES: hypothetical protein [unclassified Streptomyces]|uniref:hypothetical protein n=1 Tax=unclassified Streptomyces TaxID=2593676 RepID=UPI002E2CA66E|nr:MULTISPECIES: hypothetical protein [unclassified Streptomyces]
MAITLSLVVILALVVLVLLRSGYLRLWPAVACALFGFLLASTGIAPAINGAITSVTGWVSSF